MKISSLLRQKLEGQVWVLVTCLLVFNPVLGFCQNPKDSSETSSPDSVAVQNEPIDLIALYDHISASVSHLDFTSRVDSNGKYYYLNDVDFSAEEFTSRADFAEAVFVVGADFSNASFDSVAAIFGAVFFEKPKFSGATFHEWVNFRSTRFDGGSDFLLAHFHEKVDFSRAKFSGVNDFSGAEFKAEVDYSEAKLDQLVFNNTTLPPYLNFQQVIASGEIDLTRTILAKDQKICWINLIDAPIEKFKMRYQKFRVFVPDSISTDTYEKLTNVYEGLLKNFKDKGYLTSYEILDKEYQEFKFTKNPNGTFMGVVFNWLNKTWNDYGYHKEWIWIFAAGFFVFFAFINWILFPQLLTSVYTIPAIEVVFKEDQRLQDFLEKKGRYPLLNFRNPQLAFYYTAFIFFGIKVSVDQMNFKRPLAISFLFFQYILGLICLAYLANFVISSTLIGG